MVRMSILLLSLELVFYWRKIRIYNNTDVEIITSDDIAKATTDLSSKFALFTLLFLIVSSCYTGFYLITQNDLNPNMVTLAGFSVYTLFNLLTLIFLIPGERSKDSRVVELDSVVYKSVNDVSSISSGI
jgi:hypothetical protein